MFTTKFFTTKKNFFLALLTAFVLAPFIPGCLLDMGTSEIEMLEEASKGHQTEDGIHSPKATLATTMSCNCFGPECVCSADATGGCGGYTYNWTLKGQGTIESNPDYIALIWLYSCGPPTPAAYVDVRDSCGNTTGASRPLYCYAGSGAGDVPEMSGEHRRRVPSDESLHAQGYCETNYIDRIITGSCGDCRTYLDRLGIPGEEWSVCCDSNGSNCFYESVRYTCDECSPTP